jgi:parallel beta-helix repeat protein
MSASLLARTSACALLAATLLAPAAHARTTTTKLLAVAGCSLYASPAGSDGAAGTAAAPLRSAQALADRLAAGQTGCLAAGTYPDGMALRHGGTSTARLTVQSYPGQRAKIVGQVYVPDKSNFVTVRNLDLDGTNPLVKPSPMVNGDDAVFTGNNVHSSVESCFVLGDKVWGVAERTLISANHVHDCGVNGTNMDQGIYVRQAVGTRIIGNVIRNNPDRGVQLYPNADQSVVQGNVIDGNGEGVIFSGEGLDVSDDNLVSRNLITNSDLRYDVEYYWPSSGAVGTGNVVSENCVWGGVRGTIMQPALGYSLISNRIANPLYTVRTGATYALSSATTCPVKPPVLPATAL